MSKETFERIAQRDSEEIRLPEGWPGVIAWLAAKFGVSAVFAAVLVWGISHIYRDQQAQTERVLRAFERQAEESALSRHAIEKLTIAVNQLTQK